MRINMTVVMLRGMMIIIPPSALISRIKMMKMLKTSMLH